jgi:hypothetical protein
MKAITIGLCAVTMLVLSGSVSRGDSIPPGTSFYIQLDGDVNKTRAASIYDIDMADNTASLIANLKTAGHRVMCYFSGGTKENYRDDVDGLPPSVIGNAVGGYPDEHWLDIRAQAVRDLMVNRMNASQAKGCDGVDPDLVTGYEEPTGFNITKIDQIAYNTWLANEAHGRGMFIALKYAPGLVQDLVGVFDLSVEEQCFQYRECPAYSAFVANGKAVFAIEYKAFNQNWCDRAKLMGFTLGFYGKSLNGNKYKPCPP